MTDKPRKKKRSGAKAGTKKRKTKKQLHEELHSPSKLGSTTSNYMLGMMQQIAEDTGDYTFTTLKDAGKFVIGIPLPAFSLEYLVCNNVLPLEKVIQIYGPSGIGKTGLALELFRIFRKLAAIGNYLEHETKFNSIWGASIIGWDTLQQQALGILACDNIDQWQDWGLKCLHRIKTIMEGTSKQLGSGRIFPYMLIIDSLMGKLSKESQDKIFKEGHGVRLHPFEAMSITYWLKAVTHKLRKYPFTIVTVNHLKERPKEGSPVPEKTRAGGQGINFQGAFELEVRRSKKIRTATVNGNRLKITCEKNSYGEDGRTVFVNCVWFDEAYRDEEGRKRHRQKTIWDWHGATVDLIANMDGKKGTDARELCGRLKAKSQTKAMAPGLGFEEPVDYHLIGRKIARSKRIMKELRIMFGIAERKVFRNDIDYEDQLRELKAEIVDSDE